MSEIESLVEELSSDPQVVQAKWFGKPCINVNGKAFVVEFGHDLVFKLGGEDHSKALSIEGAKLFDPRGKGNPLILSKNGCRFLAHRPPHGLTLQLLPRRLSAASRNKKSTCTVGHIPHYDD